MLFYVIIALAFSENFGYRNYLPPVHKCSGKSVIHNYGRARLIFSKGDQVQPLSSNVFTANTTELHINATKEKSFKRLNTVLSLVLKIVSLKAKIQLLKVSEAAGFLRKFGSNAPKKTRNLPFFKRPTSPGPKGALKIILSRLTALLKTVHRGSNHAINITILITFFA